jgi:hypothetical protein
MHPSSHDICVSSLPNSGSLFNYDNNVAFWNFAAVGNYAGLLIDGHTVD